MAAAAPSCCICRELLGKHGGPTALPCGEDCKPLDPMKFIYLPDLYSGGAHAALSGRLLPELPSLRSSSLALWDMLCMHSPAQDCCLQVTTPVSAVFRRHAESSQSALSVELPSLPATDSS